MIEKMLKVCFLEIECVFVCIGMVEIVVDLMLLNLLDGYIMLKLVDWWFDLKKLCD